MGSKLNTSHAQIGSGRASCTFQSEASAGFLTSAAQHATRFTRCLGWCGPLAQPGLEVHRYKHPVLYRAVAPAKGEGKDSIC